MLLHVAQPEDALAVARVHVRSWQAAYRGLLPDEYLQQLRPEDRARNYDFATDDPLKPQTMVGVEDGVIAGFVTTGPWRDVSLPGYGELLALYVDPAHWGRGLGVELVSAARRRLFDGGFRFAALWLLAGNVRADRFYLRDGWMPDGEEKTDVLWGVTVNECRYRRQLVPEEMS